MSNTSKLIKEIRRKNNIRQDELAKLLKVSANYISLIENDKKKPGLKFLKNLSDHFRYPLFLFLQDDLMPKPKTQKEKDIYRKLNFLLQDIQKLAIN